MTFLALLLGCAVACAGQLTAEQDPSELPVSLERIKERLNRPATLQLPVERDPDFRATIIEAFTLPETVLEALRRNLAGDVTPKRIPSGTITPPLITVDLLQVVTQMKRQWAAYFVPAPSAARERMSPRRLRNSAPSMIAPSSNRKRNNRFPRAFCCTDGDIVVRFLAATRSHDLGLHRLRLSASVGKRPELLTTFSTGVLRHGSGLLSR